MDAPIDHAPQTPREVMWEGEAGEQGWGHAQEELDATAAAQLVDFGDVARVDRVSLAETRVRGENGVVVARDAQHRAAQRPRRSITKPLEEQRERERQ